MIRIAAPLYKNSWAGRQSCTHCSKSHPPSRAGRDMMGLLHRLVLLSFYATAAASEDGKHWCYPLQKCMDASCEEPQFWSSVAKECDGGNQSPINIVTRDVEYDWSLPPFRFEKYDEAQPSDWTIENNGHTVKVTLGEWAKISMGGLPGAYKALQFHFHWGNNESRKGTSSGSEHSIDGERFAMELHIVHMKDEFDSIEKALESNGLAVLGFFIKDGETNANYVPLISKLQDIPFPKNKTKMPALPLESLIPKTEDLTSYYRYTGSLTTPGCNEGVQWTLFEEPIELGLSQIQEFWMKLYFGKNKDWPMADNFRPVQPLGDRVVYKSESNALLPPAKSLLLIPTAASLLLSVIH